MYGDILWYYERNLDLYPIKHKNMNPMEVTKYNQEIKEYQSEYHYYKIELKAMNFKELEEDLERYFTEEEILKFKVSTKRCNDKINELINENYQLLRELKIISEEMDLEEYKKAISNKEIKGIVFKEEDFEKMDAVKIIEENNVKINLLQEYFDNHPNFSASDADFDVDKLRIYKIQLQAEEDAEAAIVTSTMFINGEMLLKGKQIFGINEKWEKEYSPNMRTVKDKYLFFEIFDDIDKCREHYVDLLEERKQLEKELNELVEKFANIKDAKEKAVLEIAEKNQLINNINEKMNFIKKYVEMQEIQMDERTQAKFNRVGEKLFEEEEFKEFSKTYQDT